MSKDSKRKTQMVLTDDDLREEYAAQLSRIGNDWSQWSEFTQWRRPNPDRFEFRQSRPRLLLLSVILILFAVERGILGLIWFERDFKLALGLVALAIAIVPIGRGITIDGTTRQVLRWWGYIPKILFSKRESFSDYKAILLTKVYGIGAGSQRTGRSVHYPLYLLGKDEQKILIKRCLWVEPSKLLAADIARTMSLPLEDKSS